MQLLIVLLALVLRLFGLNQSLWLDEAIQAQALMGQLGPLLSYALADFQPPLYHFLLKGWTAIVGYSEIALRFPSLLFGLLTVVYLGKLGTLLYSRRVGILASLLAATSPLLIYYSQEGRTYMLTTWLVCACFYYLARYLRLPTRLSLSLFTLFLLLTLWTSYLSWTLVPVLGLYLFLRRLYQPLFGLMIAALTLLFWFPSLASSLRLGLTDAGNLPGWQAVVGDASLKAIVLTWVKFSLGRISFVSRWLYGGVVIFLSLLHLRILSRVPRLSLGIIGWWLFAPPLLALLFSLFIPVYSYTRLLFVLPAYLLLLALGLARARSPLPTAILLCTNLIFLSLYWFTPRFHREDWRSVVATLNSSPSSSIVAVPSLRVSAPLKYYQLARPLTELPTASLVSAPLYYVRYAEDIFDPARLGQTNLSVAGYTMRNQQSYPGIQVDLYEHRN